MTVANETEDLTLHYARYGSIEHKRDVLGIIDDQISPNDRLALLVSNDSLGGDCYSGKAKELHIIYTFNGVLCEEILDEGEMLIIPQPFERVKNDSVLSGSTLLDSIGMAVVVMALFWGISRTVKSWKWGE